MRDDLKRAMARFLVRVLQLVVKLFIFKEGDFQLVGFVENLQTDPIAQQLSQQRARRALCRAQKGPQEEQARLLRARAGHVTVSFNIFSYFMMNDGCRLCHRATLWEMLCC